MKFKRDALVVFFSSLAALLLSACEDPFDCIIDDRPVLSTASLPQPVLNQVFNGSIGVSIQNNPRDDDYYYSWTLNGSLPPGISYVINDRSLRFSGTATALGSYAYSVRVYVQDDIFQNSNQPDASELCRQSVRRNYSMEVAPI